MQPSLIVRYVPGWFPGTGWKAKAVKYREHVEQMLRRPYEWTKEQTVFAFVLLFFSIKFIKNDFR